jgi:hypothetical protein
MLAITLDNLSHRYNCLPSQALACATTLDLYVLDISTRWYKYQQDKANGAIDTQPRPNEAEMLRMVERVKQGIKPQNGAQKKW